MGIPRFFRFISEQFPQTATSASFNNGFNLTIDNLYLDANGILHNSAREIYFEQPKQPRLARRSTPEPDREKLVFAAITDYMNQLLQFVKPSKLFYIAIDGPAPLAKQAQQRQRRYKSALEKSDEELATFDSTAITPGTVFMEQLATFIRDYIAKMRKKDPIWKNITVIFSPANVPGEGEHKIVSYIRQQPDSPKLRHCMYGLDADLFMLSLATHCPHFYLLREDQFRTVWGDTLFYKVDIQALRTGIIAKWGAKTESTEDKNLIDDFVFICFMAGNDFLHALPPCHDLSESIEFLMDLRKQTLGEGYITSGPATFNLNNLTKFLTQVAVTETQAISAQFYKQNFPNLTLNSSLIDPHKPVWGIDLEKYRKLYYRKAGVNANNKKEVHAFCKHYLQGLEWVHHYYHNEPVNWQWYYPYHYSPLVTDLVDYLTGPTTKLNRVSNKKSKPIKPFHQLLCVVPPKSKDLLPKFLHQVYTGPLRDYYPTSFELDLEGKTREWEAIALLPFIEIDKIFQEYTSAYNTADPKSRDYTRNNFGKTHTYKGKGAALL